jgi:hypothetical protein
MKIKPGKFFNSIKNVRCCQIIHFFNLIKLFKSNKSYEEINNNQKSNSNKLSWKENIRLFYYTFIYNESNDMLSVMEAFLHPFIDCLGRFLRILGWV